MSATIAGVAPPGLGSVRRVGRATPDLMVPLVMEPRMRPDTSRSQPNSWWLLVMGRTRPGTTAEQARANLEPAFRGAAIEAYNIWRATASEEQLAVRGDPEIPRLTLVAGNRGSYDVSDVAARPLPVLAAVFVIVLLIVAVNVASLMLSRTESRHHELAVRRAIGAGRWRLIRQLLTESVVLAVMGGGAGLAVAYASRGLFVTLGESAGLAGVPVLTPETLAFVTAVSFLTGLLFGAVPAWRASRGEETIGAYSAGLRASASRSRLGKSLVVAQVSLSLILLVGAGLFLETLTNLRAVDTGFNSENLVVFTVDPTFGSYEGEEARDMYERLFGALQSAPGVRAVSSSSYPLLSGVFLTTPIRPQRTGSPIQVSFMWVHHSFFNTMEMPLVLGRGFSPADNQASPAAAVINETAARELFPDSTPIGERFGRFGEEGFPVEIVGVVQDTKYSTVRNDPPPMVFYAEAQQERVESQAFAVRTVESPEITLPAIRAAVRDVDPDLPLLSVTTQQALEARLLRSERMFASTATVFGGLALTVAAIGLFGLMSYTVTRRTREIGIRIALGARNDRILGEILRESFVVVGIGIVLGLAGALAATRFVESMLFGLERNDPATIVAGVVIMLAVSLVAAYVPSWKASRVNPIVALRHE